MNGKDGPVLVLDSGIGGLSVLSELRTRLPDRPFIYVADESGFPYGAWDEHRLIARVVALVDRLIAAHGPALVVIACNTASTLVLPALRDTYPVTFVGTVPAIKPAAARSETGLISVLATPGTMEREYTRSLIAEFAGRCHVRLIGAPKLAQLAEDEMRGQPASDNDIAEQIAPCFVEERGRRTDIVVLACTHYPFLRSRFRSLSRWPVLFLDPAPAIARHAAGQLEHASNPVPAKGLAVTTAVSVDHRLADVFRRFGLAKTVAIDFERPNA